MIMYKMFSDAALAKFREFAAVDAATRARPQGAADTMPLQLSKRKTHVAVTLSAAGHLAVDGRRLAGMTPAQKQVIARAMDAAGGENEGELPHQATIEAILNAASEGGDEDGAIATLLDSIWPGCAGQMVGDKPEPGEPDYDGPGDLPEHGEPDYDAAGEEGAEDDDDELLTPATQFTRAHSAKDQPPPFKSIPGKNVRTTDNYEYPTRSKRPVGKTSASP
jgi:hypothetical protein